jgi:hypothetical protein
MNTTLMDGLLLKDGSCHETPLQNLLGMLNQQRCYAAATMSVITCISMF